MLDRPVHLTELISIYTFDRYLSMCSTYFFQYPVILSIQKIAIIALVLLFVRNSLSLTRKVSVWESLLFVESKSKDVQFSTDLSVLFGVL